MSKKTSTKKDLIIGGVITSLMMGGTAMASLKGSSSDEGGQFFKIKELKSGYRLAHEEKADEGEKKAEEKNCAEKDKKDGEKKCGEKDKKADEKSCSEKGCGEKGCGK